MSNSTNTGLVSSETLDAIVKAHQAATLAAKNALSFAMDCGRLLCDEKATIAHGDWTKWLADHCPQISARTDRLYRRLYRNRERLGASQDPNRTIGEATRLIAAPPKRHCHADLDDRCLDELEEEIENRLPELVAFWEKCVQLSQDMDQGRFVKSDAARDLRLSESDLEQLLAWGRSESPLVHFTENLGDLCSISQRGIRCQP